MLDFIFDCFEKALDRFEEDVNDVLDGSAFNPLKVLDKTIDRAKEDIDDLLD